jgi:hypothetical protein
MEEMEYNPSILKVQKPKKRCYQIYQIHDVKKVAANTMVTTCPPCLINIEDAIKVGGQEGKMQAVDLCELFDRHMIIDKGDQNHIEIIVSYSGGL